MFFTGYFKKINERMDSEDNRYLELSIPNREVKYIFRTKILKWFEEKVKAKDALKQIKEKGYDMELRNEGYKNIIKYGISFCGKDCYIKLGEE